MIGAGAAGPRGDNPRGGGALVLGDAERGGGSLLHRHDAPRPRRPHQQLRDHQGTRHLDVGEWLTLGLKIALDVVFPISAALSTTVARSCWTAAPRCRVRTTTAAAVTTARVSNTPRSLPRNYTPVSCLQSPAARTVCATPGAGSTPTAPSPRPPSSPCPARWSRVLLIITLRH